MSTIHSSIIGNVDALTGTSTADSGRPPRGLHDGSALVITSIVNGRPGVVLMYGDHDSEPAACRLRPRAAVALAKALRQRAAALTTRHRPATASDTRVYEHHTADGATGGVRGQAQATPDGDPVVVLGEGRVLALTPAEAEELATLLDAAATEAALCDSGGTATRPSRYQRDMAAVAMRIMNTQGSHPKA